MLSINNYTASPLVAGVLANFLSYNSIPFDTTNADLEFVKSAKKYVQETASWKRKSDVEVPVIWNLIDEEHNPKRQQTTTTTTAAAMTTTTAAVMTTTTTAAVTTTPAATPTPVAPYAQGTCGIHVMQVDVSGNGKYALGVTMTDNDGNQIGHAQGVPYSDSNALGVQSKLEDTLWCKPEKQNDYIAFALGDQAWPSNGDFADEAVPSCTVGDWKDDVEDLRKGVSPASSR